RGAGGWLVGYHGGEWGGSLWWYDEKFANHKRLAAGEIVERWLISDDFAYIFLSAIPPSGPDGAVVVIGRGGAVLATKRLGRVEAGMLLSDGTLLIGTHEGRLFYVDRAG